MTKPKQLFVRPGLLVSFKAQLTGWIQASKEKDFFYRHPVDLEYDMIFYKPMQQIKEEAKLLRLEKLKWLITFSLFLLFMYKACECIKQHTRFETVTRTSEDSQEKYPLPQICVSQAEISNQVLQSLNITSKGYRSQGIWQSTKNNFTEEEIYERLSTKFEDIIEKLVVDVLHEDNDNYDKITIFEQFPNGSNSIDLELTSCDYYYSLQCFCINLSSQLKTRAIQKLYIFMKKNAHVAVVAPGNYYGYERKRNEMYTELGYSYRYQVSYPSISTDNHIIIIPGLPQNLHVSASRQ